MKIEIPSNVQFIIDTFYNNGFEAFIVGGCIRDSLLGLTPKDYDIATSALPEETIQLFKKTIPTGLQHGTVTVVLENEGFEVTTYRTESTYLNNRCPESVNFVKNIKEDLSRRDFTINAFAYNHKEGLLDFFNGQEDLKNKIIRSVGDSNTRFNEDALRMLRAVRFSSQLNFSIEKNTFDSIKRNNTLISNISFERIRDEFTKILTSNNPKNGLLNLLDSKLLLKIIPEFETILDATNSLNIFSLVQETPNILRIRLSALFYKLDNNLVAKLLARLRFENKIIQEVSVLTRNSLNIVETPTRPNVKRFINYISLDYIPHLFLLQNSIILNSSITSKQILLNETKKIYKSILTLNEPLSIKDLSISGNDLITHLNITPGKEIGLILNSLLNEVLDNPELNTFDSLLQIAKSISSSL